MPTHRIPQYSISTEIKLYCKSYVNFREKVMCVMIDISVIIPMYNSENYIEETLLSVINQSYRNFEIIVIDDGSKDASGVKAQRIFERHTDVISKIITQENKGLSGARNEGIKNAEGRYLCFIDSDDILDKLHLQSLYELAEKNELNVVHCNYELTSDNNRQGTVVNKQEGLILSREEVIKYAVRRKPAIIVCGMLIKRKFLIDKELMFNETLRFGEDSDYIWKTIFHCGQIGYSQMATYKYLNHPNSIMKTITTQLGDIYLKEFGKTIKNIIERNTQDQYIASVVYYREIIGFFHVFSLCSNKDEFIRMSNQINRKEMFSILKGFPDIRIRILSCILSVNPTIFYKVFHKKG